MSDILIDASFRFNMINNKFSFFSKAAASCVIADCPDEELNILSENEGEEERKEREKVPEAKANIALCWSKYCLNLLKISAESDNDETKGKKLTRVSYQFPL